MRKKKILLFVFLLCLLPIILILFEWCFFGGGFKRIYYNVFYEPNGVQVAVDSNFRFYEKGYTADLKLNSRYYVPHRILLYIKTKNVPVDYNYSGQIKLELFIKDKLLESYLVESPVNLWRREDDYFGNYTAYGTTQERFAESTRAFELAEITFNLFRFKWGRLKNMRIRATVIEPDKQLKQFCDNAELVIVPDLRM